MSVPSTVNRYPLAVSNRAVRFCPAALRTSPHKRDLPVRNSSSLGPWLRFTS